MGFMLRRTTFPLPGREILLDVVDDVESLVTDLNDADKVPCWAEVWPAARALARYIWEHVEMSGLRVLELGCGLGLPGTVAAVKGALVTFSDYNGDALELSLRNAALNGAKAAGFLGDWRCFALNSCFDWIIGSDVFYDPKLNPYVLQIYRGNLACGGRLLLSHQRREHTYRFVEEVKRELGLVETRLDTIEYEEESVFGHFPVSIHSLGPEKRPRLMQNKR